MVSRFATLLAAGLTVVSAVPAPQSSDSDSGSSPCAQIAAAVAEGEQAFVGSVAYACLKSVPNPSDAATSLIDSLQAYIQWQSSLAWLKSPPKEYAFPSLDLVGRLNDIKSKASGGKYDSEYDFQADILLAVRAAHDGHLNYVGDALGQFVFQAPLLQGIVSVSRDGKEVPKLYHASSLDSLSDGDAISKINGKDAAQYITESNQVHSSMQDPDSQWNGGWPVYASPSRVATFAADFLYHEESFTVEYENGTSIPADVVATLTGASDPSAWASITSGEDFYSAFCVPQKSRSSARKRALTDQPQEIRHLKVRDTRDTGVFARQSESDSLPGYPDPVASDKYGVISGYFLQDSGYDDTAVLAISAFLPSPQPEDTIDFLADFQGTAQSFLEKCKDSGKKKLVIDLTGNGGGAIALAHDLFVQLFPSKSRFAADNLRRPASLVNFADIMTGVFESGKIQITTSNQQNAANALGSSIIGSALNPQAGIFVVQGDRFKNIADLTAENDLQGDKFIEYQWQPFTIPDSSFNLTGVGSRANPAPAVFAPEDVVVLTDGTCGSSCTIFSYFMIYDSGVKFISVGGRPQTGTMQSLGGVEGSQVFPFAQMAEAASAAYALAADDSMTSDELSHIAEAYAVLRSTPVSPPQLNAKNAFAPFNAKTPLQFLTQNANCRIFYTADMVADATSTWKRTVDAWSDPNKWCVADSQTAVGEVLDSNSELDASFDASATRHNVGKVVGVVVGALALWLTL